MLGKMYLQCSLMFVVQVLTRRSVLIVFDANELKCCKLSRVISYE